MTSTHSDYEKLENKYVNLGNHLNMLIDYHNKLDDKYTKLVSHYNKLNNDCIELDNRYVNLGNRLNTLIDSHNELLRKHYYLKIYMLVVASIIIWKLYL